MRSYSEILIISATKLKTEKNQHSGKPHGRQLMLLIRGVRRTTTLRECVIASYISRYSVIFCAAGSFI